MATKYFTGNGDSGNTTVIGSGSIPKSSKLVYAIGDIDELNSYIGLASFYVVDEFLRGELKAIQNDLFMLGAELASTFNSSVHSAQKVDASRVKRLEEGIKIMGDRLPELKAFVIPGGSEAAAHLHVARAIARRAERSIVDASVEYPIGKEVISYANRLSSFLFVAALYVNKLEGIEETHPSYK